VRDGALVTASANLDTLAGALRDAVNAIQTDPAAFDLDGAGTTAAPLFGGTAARDLVVTLTDPRRLAAALSTEPGDNQNALRLADLRTAAPVSVAPASAPALALGATTLAGFLATELGRVGEAAAAAADAAAASEQLAAQLEAQHLAISGVNLNEELTNLLKTQRAFQAAARLLSVTNAMLDDLLHIL
jgi:flagellar hook-associated protein 1 FlgK